MCGNAQKIIKQNDLNHKNFYFHEKQIENYSLHWSTPNQKICFFFLIFARKDV